MRPTDLTSHNVGVEFSSLTTEEVGPALEQRIVLLPVGSTEQHGPHLPLSVDTDIPEAICRLLATNLGGMIAPPLYYGARSLPQSGGGMAFPGTIFVQAATLISYIKDIVRSYVRSGASRIVIINGHYENEGLIFEALDELREAGEFQRTKVIALSWWSAVDEKLVVELFGLKFVGWHAEHASLVETSIMAYISPEKVRPIRVNHESPPKAGVYLYPVNEAGHSTRGVLHRTSEASPAAGKSLMTAIVGDLTGLISEHLG